MTPDELALFVDATRKTLVKAMQATTHHRFTILELAKAVHLIAVHLHQQAAHKDP